ncbi:MAG: HipA family kinase [Bryobacteraceae bacterium]
MPLTARRAIRKMRGGAQSYLLQADDDACYVVKFRNNPQHRRILVNELVASVFLQYLQISTPEIALIRVTPEFLRENSDVYISLGDRRIPVEPGWHYGSRFPGDPARTAVYDFLPDALLAQVSNAREFAGVLVFDKWAANADGRQSVFYRALVRDWSPGEPRAAKPGFVVRMIDHGFIFDGPNWTFTDSPLQGLYPRRLVYENIRSLDDFQPWLNRVVHFPEAVVDKAWRQVPPEWIEGEEDEFHRLLERLLERRRRVADLLAACRAARNNPFPNWR